MSRSDLTLPPEVEAVFKKLANFLESDDEQNKLLPEPIRSSITAGLSCDELPSALGEFGRTPSNPVPTNGPIGQVIYLSRLRTQSGSPVMFHRVRAEHSDVGAIDVYEVLSLDRKVRETLFFSMYHPRKSRKTPRGYTYAAQVDPSNFTYGVNHIVPNFPTKLDAYIRKWQKQAFGIPLPVSRVRESINGSPLHPSVLTEAEDTDLSSPERQMSDDLLKLLHAAQDPRFKGKDIAIGNDGLLLPISSGPQDPHVFEIVPTVSSTRSADGTVSHDDRIMYVLTDDAEAALDQILEPYGRSAAWYLDGLKVKSPGPWAYVCLRQEYNIASHLVAQRNKIADNAGFQFTFYDTRVDTKAPGFVPKVGCLAFYSKASVEAAANVLAFLRPAWIALREKPAHQHWLIVLNEEPELVLAEAGQRP